MKASSRTALDLCRHRWLHWSCSHDLSVLLELVWQSNHHHHRDPVYLWTGVPQCYCLSSEEFLYQEVERDRGRLYQSRFLGLCSVPTWRASWSCTTIVWRRTDLEINTRGSPKYCHGCVFFQETLIFPWYPKDEKYPPKESFFVFKKKLGNLAISSQYFSKISFPKVLSHNLEEYIDNHSFLKLVAV